MQRRSRRSPSGSPRCRPTGGCRRAGLAAVGCGTSFHAAQTTGNGIDVLELVLAPPDVDVLVLVSHEGGTPMTVEAAACFREKSGRDREQESLG